MVANGAGHPRSRWRLMIVLSVVLHVAIAAGQNGLSCATDAGADQSASSNQWAAVTNSSVRWEITPELDAAVLLDADVRRLLETSDRAAVVQHCLPMLEDDRRYVAGHVILCYLFDRLDPCVEMLDSDAVKIYLHALQVDVNYSRDPVPAKTISVDGQRESVRRYWEPLIRGGMAKFIRLHTADRGVARVERAGRSPADDRRVVRVVKGSLAQGPMWVAAGLGSPTPMFPEAAVSGAASKDSPAFRACMEALDGDESWAAAHLLLAQAFGSDRRRRLESNSDGFDLTIDGLTIRVDVLGTDRHYEVTYPRANVEKHLVRYKWAMRAMK